MSNAALEGRIRLLAWSFPALLKAPGVDPWDALALERWAGGLASSGERHAALFVLSVWNRHDWGSKFNMAEAMNVWDDQNLKSFKDWVNDPWWG